VAGPVQRELDDVLDGGGVPKESFLNMDGKREVASSASLFHSDGSNCIILLTSVAVGRCRGLLCQQRFNNGLRPFNRGSEFSGISGRSRFVTTLWMTSTSRRLGNGGLPE
jgi:hypothetical protein